jgi:multicomponent Na+:H+ antiporter subunit D
MVLGLGLFTLAGLAAAVLYIIHHIVVKTTLFLVGGLIEQTNGTSRLSSLGGLVRTSPVIAGLFLVAALSLAGIPPFSGFPAKFAVYDAAARSEQWVALGAATVVGLLTLFSMFKVWIGAFWSPAEDVTPVPGPSPDIHPSTVENERRNGPLLMVLPTLALALVILGLGLAAGPLYELSERAAADLLNTRGYIDAVLGP